jgi:hypothetical protein
MFYQSEETGRHTIKTASYHCSLVLTGTLRMIRSKAVGTHLKTNLLK